MNEEEHLQETNSKHHLNNSFKKQKVQLGEISGSPTNYQTEMHKETLCVHAGLGPDQETGSLNTPINLSSTYKQTEPGKHKGYEYSRSLNPTRKTLESCIAQLEGGKHGFAFASGSSATSTITQLLSVGDHIISSDDVYGGTYRYFNQVLPQCQGVETSFVDLQVEGDMIENEIKRHVRESKTKMLWVESPTNPCLKVTDIEKIAQIGKKLDLLTVVDNTFATPYLQNPLKYGIDIVAHSATKYINGHSDVVMGLIVTNNDAIAEKIKFLQNASGAIPSPFDCYLVLRGVKTLALRVERQSKNAMKIAEFLSTHEKVQRVYYPGLAAHPGHKTAAHQMRHFGGIVTVCIKGGKQQCFEFLKALKVFVIAESLGAVESLANFPATMTHGAIPLAVRERLGITDSMVRLSVGIEHCGDLIQDLDSALKTI